MGKGNYFGGSTILRGFSPKVEVRTGARLNKKEKKKQQKAPGLHVLSEDDRKEVLRKIRKSRKDAEKAEREKRNSEQLRRREAFEKIKWQMLDRNK